MEQIPTVTIYREGRISNINCRSPSDSTALRIAAHAGRRSVVKTLLKVPEIQLDLRDRRGRNALGKAFANEHYDVVKLIQAKYGPSARILAQSKACEVLKSFSVAFHQSPNADTLMQTRLRQDPLHKVLDALAGIDSFSVIASNILNMLDASHPDAIVSSWVHFPANNLAWMESALAHLCFKDGPLTANRYHELLTFLDDHHNCIEAHSRYITPKCLLRYHERAQRVGEPNRGLLYCVAMPVL